MVLGVVSIVVALRADVVVLAGAQVSVVVISAGKRIIIGGDVGQLVLAVDAEGCGPAAVGPVVQVPRGVELVSVNGFVIFMPAASLLQIAPGYSP